MSFDYMREVAQCFRWRFAETGQSSLQLGSDQSAEAISVWEKLDVHHVGLSQPNPTGKTPVHRGTSSVTYTRNGAALHLQRTRIWLPLKPVQP